MKTRSRLDHWVTFYSSLKLSNLWKIQVPACCGGRRVRASASLRPWGGFWSALVWASLQWRLGHVWTTGSPVRALFVLAAREIEAFCHGGHFEILTCLGSGQFLASLSRKPAYVHEIWFYLNEKIWNLSQNLDPYDNIWRVKTGPEVEWSIYREISIVNGG